MYILSQIIKIKKSNFEKLTNVISYKNMGQVPKIIPTPNKISDHPIIILKLKIPIKIEDIFEKINILDIGTINNNIESIKVITRDEQNIELKESKKIITRKGHQIKLNTKFLETQTTRKRKNKRAEIQKSPNIEPTIECPNAK